MKRISEIKHKHDMHYFYKQIDSNIEHSFTHEQSKAVKNIILRCLYEKSSRGVTLTVYFWFIKGFFVLFQLAPTRQKIYLRKSAGSAYFFYFIFKNLLNLVISLFILVLFIFSILYTIKSLLGWDIIRGFHLHDLIHDIFNYF